jgi:hypothetical protein
MPHRTEPAVRPSRNVELTRQTCARWSHPERAHELNLDRVDGIDECGEDLCRRESLLERRISVVGTVGRAGGSKTRDRDRSAG